MQNKKRDLGVNLLRKNFFWFAVVAVVLMLLPVALPLVGLNRLVYLIVEIAIVALFATSFNLLFGHTGMTSFGHALFFGFGAYTVGILLKHTSVPFGLALLLVPFVGLVSSLIVGRLSLHLTALYFALLTFAFSMIGYTIIFKARGITGGDDGLVGIPMPSWLDSPIYTYFFIVAICLVCIYMLFVIHNSPFASILRGIRENPERVKFCGVNIQRFRLISFVVAGVFASIAGGLWTVFNRAAFVDSLSLHQFNMAIMPALLGGMYTFFGPAIGAIIIVSLDKLLGAYTPYWSSIMGATIVLIIIFFPYGVLGSLKERFKRQR